MSGISGDLRGVMEILEKVDQEEVGLNLLRRCRRDDPDACNALLTLYNRRIFNTAYRILGEESQAEDALQETLINIYRGLNRFRGASKISTWVSRITVNVCLGMIRKGKNKRTVALEEDDAAKSLPANPTDYIDPHRHVVAAELSSFIEETFVRMSKKQGIVVRLHDLEGNTIQEIARILRCPVGTIKSRLFYGRQEFRDIYQALINERTLGVNSSN
jgi:RNA polymerase sigma-70 factor, ECF subfamily